VSLEVEVEAEHRRMGVAVVEDQSWEVEVEEAADRQSRSPS
jgi:hypothetical protein